MVHPRAHRLLISRFATVLTLMMVFVTPAGLAHAQRPVTTLTFTERPLQPVTGISIRGVTFTFAIGGINSTEAVYGGSGPGQLVYVQDPSLTGNAHGTLTLRFNRPTSVLAFGVAVSCFGCTLTDGATIELFGPFGNAFSLNKIPTISSSRQSPSEGHFSYTGAPVGRAVLHFSTADPLQKFALDNLTFQSLAGATTPESPAAGTSHPGPAWSRGQ